MDDYARRGYGGASVGFGERIGIAVVDFQLGFTDPRFPLGGADLTDRAVRNTATLLSAARAARSLPRGRRTRLSGLHVHPAARRPAGA